MSTPATASTSKAIYDAGDVASSRRAFAGDVTSRRCSRSNDSRPFSSRATHASGHPLGIVRHRRGLQG